MSQRDVRKRIIVMTFRTVVGFIRIRPSMFPFAVRAKECPHQNCVHSLILFFLHTISIFAPPDQVVAMHVAEILANGRLAKAICAHVIPSKFFRHCEPLLHFHAQDFFHQAAVSVTAAPH